MIRNYIKVTLRNLHKNLLYSFVNTAGLAVGLACVLVIISYIRLELSYDKFHDQGDRIYRITQTWNDDGRRVESAKVHAPLAPLISETVPSASKVARVYPYPVFISKDGQSKSKEDLFCFADSTFFEIFSFTALEGDLATALNAPRTVVLTKSAAIKYFGSTDIVGQVLIYEDERQQKEFNIRAVIEDVPQNSHMTFEILASFSSLNEIMPWYNSWYYPPMYTYILLSPSGKASDFLATVRDVSVTHMPERVQAEKRAFGLQNLASIHLYSDLEDEWEANASYEFVELFMVIAGFILLIACINFTNLATARATKRAREVGMRKVMGAARIQIIWQFLGESFITTCIAFLLAFGLAEIVMIYAFNDVIGKELSLAFMISQPFIYYTAIGIVIISVLAGMYPAIYLSGFSPIRIFKGSSVSQTAGRRGLVRKGLVTFQFFISCLLILGTIIVYRQTSFLRNMELGFDKDHVIALAMVDRYAQKNFNLLKESLLEESAVRNVGLSSTLPGRQDFHGFQVSIDDKEEMNIKTLGADEDLLNTLGIEILSGRGFSKDIATDQREAFILNKAAVEKFGWDDPLGKEVELTTYVDGKDIRKGKVIGVVDDFHFQSLYNQVEPLLIYINKHPYYSDFISVKFEQGSLHESVELLKRKWENFHPDKPIEYYFLDDELDQLYKTEVKRSTIFSAFAVLSVIISCLGLFGLSAFSVQQRTKEVGIRKVLGASIVSIFSLLAKEYMMLVLIANIIAWPAVWYFGQEWLAGYAYQIDTGHGMYILTLLAALGITLLTISYQAIKTAIINPAETLKEE